ncbi:MAG: hypothetical protein HUU32_15210 [Calditrichaceae bacterium]|nr:hypothetical protein [Calditrichia bacterium]NUQ42734.1 hypothetical protein [Calditrichaceae bacterium]
MPVMLADILILLAAIYLCIGLLFAIPFAFFGAGQIDPTARKATAGFKLIIIPGTMALWPLLAFRWLKGVAEPPEEKNPHRLAARGPENNPAREGKG